MLHYQRRKKTFYSVLKNYIANVVSHGHPPPLLHKRVVRMHMLEGAGGMLPWKFFCELDAVGSLLRPFLAQSLATIFSITCGSLACVILHILVC